jgi:hypothetical protein
LQLFPLRKEALATYAGQPMPQASSTPSGFHSATPYLIFDGTAADAIAFYRDVFAATELPGRLTNPAGKILDAAILIGDSVIRVGAVAHCEEPPDTGRRIVIRSPLRYRSGRGDRAGCGPRRENPVAHQGSILRRPLRKHRRSIRAGLDYRHAQGRSVAGRDLTEPCKQIITKGMNAMPYGNNNSKSDLRKTDDRPL